MTTRALLALGVVLATALPLSGQATTAYTGATLWDGTGAAPVPNATIVVQDGRIVAAGAVQAPAGATVVDLSGRWIIPGLVNTHGHVDGRWAPEGVTDADARVVEDLLLYARYGITTVNSLGGGGDASIRVRDVQEHAGLDRARLYVAGPVIGANTPEAGRAAVDRNAAMGVDWIKFRVDDNLGTSSKMSPAVGAAIIARAHELDLRVATHLFYLDDAKWLLRAGTDMIAHSVRDLAVDDELIGLIRERGICYVPTLTRELSTFVYSERPEFFDDPFFLQHSSSAEIERVSAPAFMRRQAESTSAARYRVAVGVAQRNLVRLVEGGVAVAMGTDSGPAARFPGYFEHLELEMMVEGGLTPEQALRSATGVAGDCLGEDVGTVEVGHWADFLVLAANPLADITNTRSLEQVYIAGNRVR